MGWKPGSADAIPAESGEYEPQQKLAQRTAVLADGDRDKVLIMGLFKALDPARLKPVPLLSFPVSSANQLPFCVNSLRWVSVSGNPESWIRPPES